MKSEKKISYGSIATVVAVAQEKGGSDARKYLDEVKDKLTDSAKELVETALENKADSE